MIKKPIQILFIHGGMTFKNRKDYLHFLKTREVSLEKRFRWYEEYLSSKLGRKFQIILPRMPQSDDAKYEDWAIHFQRLIPLLKGKLILIGVSLGGIFLAKYLSEHKFPKKILATYLICPPYDNTLPTEDLVGGFKLKSDLSRLQKNSPRLTLLFAQHDDVVPISQAKKFVAKLPQAKIIIYKHIKGHFKVTKFPEIVRMIKADVNNK